MAEFTQQLAAMLTRAQAHEQRQLTATRADLDAVGADAVPFMRANHPWQNRTGAAERGLDVQPLHPAGLTAGRIALVGRAPYQKWLELAHGSRYQIIQSTAALTAVAFLARLRRRWS